MAKYITFNKYRYVRMKDEARQQMAVISRNRTYRRRGNGAAGQPFYAKFI